MISLLLKSQLRFALRHPIGPAASFAGVAVAVAAVVAVHLVGQSIRADLGDPSIAGHTHVASRGVLAETAYFDLRRRWRAGTRTGGAADAADRGWAGSIRAMFPVIEGFVDIRGQRRRVIGFDPVAAGDIDPGSVGIPPASPSRPGAGMVRFLADDVVMVSPETVQDIAADGGKIAGIAVTAVETATDTVLTDLPTAQRLLGRENEIDAIWLRVADARTRLLDWLDRLLPGIAASLPRYADPVIAGFTVTAASRWNPARRFADAILFNLGMLSLLCLLMAAFIAFQASASSASRRRAEESRLLAIGAPRGTLRWMACTEGFVVGCLGATAGLGLGSVVAAAILQAAVAGSATAPDAATRTLWPGLPLDGWVVGKALACGVATSAWGPLAEGRFAANPSIRIVFGLFATAVAVFGLANGALGWAFVALAAICANQIVIVVPLAAKAAGPLAGFGTPKPGRSLRLRANLRATAALGSEIRLALGALSVAAAVAIGMGVMVESLRRDFTAMLDIRLPHGIYIETASDVPESELDAILGLAGVRDVRRYGDMQARVAQGPVDVRIARLDAAEAARYDFGEAVGDRVLINEVGARRFGVEAGDIVQLASSGTSLAVEIAHVFRDFGSATSRFVLPAAFVSGLDPDALRWRRLSVRADPDVTSDLAATLAERYGASRVRNDSEIRALAMAVFDRSFLVSRSLAVLALVVAAIGLYAALTALQASRAGEFRLFSAVGLTRLELWRLAMSQTAALGAVALVASLPLGLVIAWVLCDFVNPASFGWSINLRLDAAAIAGPLLLGAAAAAAAGALPPSRAVFRGTP